MIPKIQTFSAIFIIIFVALLYIVKQSPTRPSNNNSNKKRDDKYWMKFHDESLTAKKCLKQLHKNSYVLNFFRCWLSKIKKSFAQATRERFSMRDID